MKDEEIAELRFQVSQLMYEIEVLESRQISRERGFTELSPLSLPNKHRSLTASLLKIAVAPVLAGILGKIYRRVFRLK